MQAQILESHDDVARATPGLYVVRSGTGAYFPVRALIDRGRARLLGEMFDDYGSVITAEISGARGAFEASDPPSGKRQITVGPEFFQAALNDYGREWNIKWWREAIQNSADAGSSHIKLGTSQNADGTYTVYCEDDGRGMDEDIIINKFLVLGGTTKVFGSGGSTGGFGKAKELLLLPWISWKIHSRDTIVEGSGIDYNVSRGDFLQGTRLEVVMRADKYADGVAAKTFLEKCYLPHIRFTVDGEPWTAHLTGGDVVAESPGLMQIYFVKGQDTTYYCHVRVRGLFMFDEWMGSKGADGTLYAEITAPSIEVLTANRDGFKDSWGPSRTIRDLANKMAVDALSALRSKKKLIRKKYQGTGKFKARERASDILYDIGPYRSGALSEHDTKQVIHKIGLFVQREQQEREWSRSESEQTGAEKEKIGAIPPPVVAEAMIDQKFLGPEHFEAAIRQLVWEPDFYIMNDIEDYAVPKKFFPETMTPTILKLAKVWTELCRFVFMQLGSSEKFGVGFVFSEKTLAMAVYEENDNSGEIENWIMLNPHKVLDKRDEIWRSTNDADLKWMYAAAIHEATHIVNRVSEHDEVFASALTKNMALCADGYRKIRQIVAGIRMRGTPEAD